MQSPPDMTSKRTGDPIDVEGEARKRLRNHQPRQFSSLPVELIQSILNEVLVLISPEESSIHFHRNHRNYNRYLSSLCGLVRVNKLFNTILTPYLYREIRLPREFSYVSSIQAPTNPTGEGPHLEDLNNNMDVSALLLANQLETHPEHAALIKKIHIDPVVRLQAGAAADCDAYTTILQQCKDTVEELAIAANWCDGILKESVTESTGTRIHTSGENLVLRQCAYSHMPKLRHLILEFDNLEHLHWILSPERLDSLEEVTLMIDNLFETDFVFGPPSDINLYESMLFQAFTRLPKTVRKMTFGLVYCFEYHNFSDIARAGEGVESLRQERVIQCLLTTLAKAQKHGTLDHLKELRLVWTYIPDSTHRCDECLRRDRRQSYPLPKLRMATRLEELCAMPMADIADFGDRTGDITTTSKLRINMSEVLIPPAYRPVDEDDEVLCAIEVLWKSLLYGRPEDVNPDQIDDEIMPLEACPHDTDGSGADPSTSQ
ncbi:hypothetical protein OC861_004889 [Tilletia horrida]|nr:hypothetical protein OC861_004889 [Tilletia horrida]